MPGRLVRDTVLVGSGSVLCQVLGTLTAVALRMIMEPALIGVWSGLRVFLGYGNFAGLGASKAAAREIAYESARGNRAATERATSVAFTINTLTSALYMLGLFAAAAWLRATSTRPLVDYWASGLVATGVFVLLSRYSTFLISVLWALQEFGRTTRLALFEAALTLVVTCAGVWFWGLYGLFVGTMVVMLGGIAYLHVGGGVRLRLSWDWPETKRLVAIGAPILAGGLALTVFRSVDKLMILAYLPDGEHALGCYSIGLMAAGALTSLANVIGVVSYPRYQVRYGETGDPREVARLALRLTEASSAVLSVVFLLAALAGPPLLAWLLPAYRPGLPALLVLLPGTLLLSLSRPACHHLITVGRQHLTVAVLLAAVLVAIASNYVALRFGAGITGVAVASTASYSVYALALGALAYGPLFSAGQLFDFFVRCAAPVLLAAGTFGFGAYVTSVRVVSPLFLVMSTICGTLIVVGWSMLWRASKHWRRWLWEQ